MKLVKKRKNPFGNGIGKWEETKMEYEKRYSNQISFRTWTDLLIEKGKRRYHWLNKSHEETYTPSVLVYPGR